MKEKNTPKKSIQKSKDLASEEVTNVVLSCDLGTRRGGLSLAQRGNFRSRLLGIDRIYGWGTEFFESGDVVGMVVDCRKVPTLRFYVNGVQMLRLVIGQEGYGQVLFPAFSLATTCQIHIASNQISLCRC